MSGHLLRVPAVVDHSWRLCYAAALQLQSSRLYLLLEGDHASQHVSARVLTKLARLFDTAAAEGPEKNVIPLLPSVGWTTGAIADLPDLSCVLKSSSHEGDAEALVKDLRALRSPEAPDLHMEALQPSSSEQAESQEQASEVHAGDADEPLAFSRVAVGGTFDRLHAGHRMLLAATALVSTHSIYIGITGDQLLAKKQHAELLQPYEQRMDAAVAFMKAVRPGGLEVSSGPLLDPKEPTAAATDPDMEALVVSSETVSGAEAINQDRAKRGFRPLKLVVVDLVGISCKSLGGDKLSSTALRAAEACRVSTE